MIKRDVIGIFIPSITGLQEADVSYADQIQTIAEALFHKGNEPSREWPQLASWWAGGLIRAGARDS